MPDLTTTRPRRSAAAAVALAASATGLTACGDDGPAAREVTVTWAVSEGVPACAYVPGSRTAEARLVLDGRPATRTSVTITVTAYADENTSQLVGTGTTTEQVEGDVHRTVRVSIPVDRPPHLGDDGDAACKLEVAS